MHDLDGLSRRDARLFSLFANQPDRSFSVDEVARTFYAGREWPEHWRVVTMQYMRIFNDKLRKGKVKARIKRVSRLGTGSPARYQYYVAKPRPTRKQTSEGDSLR